MFEWPTLAIALSVYTGWLSLTWWHAALPGWSLAVLGGLLLAWHSSLQHETIHGHPTGSRFIDYLIGAPPLALWLPYSIYRRSHRAHHSTPRTTDPVEDPESSYCTAARGARYWLARSEATLAARLMIGPITRIGAFLVSELRRAWESPRAFARDWLSHFVSLIPVLAWLDYVGLSLGTYLLAFVYPGTALSLLRSFAEHRADADQSRRAAIVVNAGLFGPLFLNNNLHAVHHARPDLAWYRLPAYYRQNRAQFAEAPHYRSYGEILGRYALRPQDDVVHPDYRPSENAS
jgi:fatty acid desaturase